jgi:hypothetical protein
VPFTPRALTKIVEESFDVREVCGPDSKPVNRPQSLPHSSKQNQSAFGTAQVSREDHVK